jgi:hypothetical protein
MKCVNCKFCVLEDYGYSNYTVEGTNADCLLNLNPDFPVDNFYGETKEHNFASTCSRFTEGSPIAIDVDHDLGHMLNYADDPEVREIIEKELMWETLNK